MPQPDRTIYRLVVLGLITLFVSGLANACRPAQKNAGPDIADIVATGRAGTQHAWALSTIVSATQGALAGQVRAPLAAGTPLPASTAAATQALPADPASENACEGSLPGQRSYIDQQGGFCIFYPEDFFVNKPQKGIVEFLGPALDQNTPPLRAYISINRKEPVSGRTLDEIAMIVWKAPRSAYRLSNILLGGQDALVAEDLQAGEASWKVKQVLFTHGGFIYLISLSPFDSAPPFDTALPDAQRFWDMAMPSFTFR